MEEKKLDVLGNEPEPGDLVCFDKDSELIVGQVVKFNNQGYPTINTHGNNEPEEIVDVVGNFAIIDMI